MTFLIVNFLSHMILQTSMALTSPVPFVIKVLVDPAILYPLLKSLNQDLGWSTEKNSQCFLHNT
jgi:hypothetical protein